MLRNEPTDDLLVEEDADRPEKEPLQSASMRDWVQAFTLPFELLILAFVGPLIVAIAFRVLGIQGPIIPAVVLPLMAAIGLSFLGAVWSQFKGIKFDRKSDTVTFPSHCIRRTVWLSEIRDANSEFAPGGTIFGSGLAAIARALNKGSNPRPSRLYVVNLSGAFGSRQVRFLSKKRRDQFLSLLRRFAPRVRITRFPAWS